MRYPVLKSCWMSVLVATTDPVIPLEHILATMLPGAIMANTTCIMFPMGDTGPMFVSPVTRIATSASGMEKTTASTVWIGLRCSIQYCTTASATVSRTMPTAACLSGISFAAVLIPSHISRKVLTSKRHSKSRAVSAAETSSPVAGHIVNMSACL